MYVSKTTDTTTAAVSNTFVTSTAASANSTNITPSLATKYIYNILATTMYSQATI